MANIKTIALSGAEIKVEIAGQNCAIRNDGTDTVYASRTAGVAAGADGVLAVPAGQSAVLRDTCGALFLLGTGSVQLVGADYDSVPFKTVSASSGSGADEVARAAISAHAGNAEIHVTEEEKSAWNAKAELADIPTSLPANGGNADTLDIPFHSGIDIFDFAVKNAEKGKLTCVRIMNGTSCPTNYGYDVSDNDFVYQICRISDSDWLTVIGYDVRSNDIFTTSCLNTVWSSWMRINDGGNADTVGGKSLNQIMTSGGLFTGDLDTLKVQCSVLAKDCANTPEDAAYWGTVCVYIGGTGSVVQIFAETTLKSNELTRVFIRHFTGNFWSPWKNIADCGNATTLETHPASDFVLKSEYDALAARVAALEGGT